MGIHDVHVVREANVCCAMHVLRVVHVVHSTARANARLHRFAKSAGFVNRFKRALACV